MLLYLLFFLGGLYSLICYLLYFFQEHLIFFPQKLAIDHTFNFDGDFEEKYFHVDEETTIHALYFFAQNPKGVILYFHGNAGSLEDWGGVADGFVKLNYDVLISDFRGFGKSTGKISELGLYQDAQMLYDVLLENIDASKITVLGRSLGTGVAVDLVSKNKVKRLILETPFSSFADLAQSRFKIIPVKVLLKYSFPNKDKLKKVNCDIVYTPTIDDLYAKGEKAKEFNFGSLATSMEGEYRPGHFNGMATIVEKFFNIINPTKAFFGQKDFQQLQIVKALVKQMQSDIEIIGIPTIREGNGLAKSSRNSLLSANAKTEALLISKCLNFCAENKNLGISELQKYIKSAFEKSRNLELEYAEFVSLNQMKEIKEWEAENQSAVCIAAYIYGVRLIDNII